MNTRASNSYWLATKPAPAFKPLPGPIDTDVAIIGGGITGITAAHMLVSAGKQVALIDAGAVWHGETGRTSAHLTEELDFGYAEILRLHGDNDARRAFESQRAAMDRIEKYVYELSIDCDYRRVDAYLCLKEGDDPKKLDEEAGALARVGFWEASRVPLVRLGAAAEGPGIRFPNQAQFHPLKYLSKILNNAVEAGARVYSNTPAVKVEPGRIVTEDGHEIRAKHVLVTTHSPIKNILFFVKQSAYRTYVIGARIPVGSADAALFWDTGDPYHYVRLVNNDFVLVGGEDHKTGQADDAGERYARLESWARERFPGMREVEYRWSGQVIEPHDGLPYIGKSPYHDGVYLATGYSGNGLTWGTFAARLLSDLVLERPNRYADLYEPTRKKIHSAADFARENLDAARHAVGDRLKRGDAASAEDLTPGEGGVVGDGPNKVAAYRDESGKLTECSATCTHLGCVVQWNTGEKTFDCPCHGSRFTAEGRVITGPATRDLKALHPEPRV